MSRPSLVIRREPTGGGASENGFAYRLNGRLIRGRREIERLEALAIPPAWTEVEIARSPRAKVQARGIDAAGRTQTIYHPAFRRRQERRKYGRLIRFAKRLPDLREAVDRDLRRRRLGRERIAACAVRLIDRELFRIGSSAYAQRYRSYGVTTLREEHLRVTTETVEFDFTGKSGARQRRRLHDPRVARLISRLEQLPGHEVFRFLDEDGVVQHLRSRHVNAYVKRHMGEEFTAKDFRTWGGTVAVATALLELPADALASLALRADAMRAGVRAAAEALGNTPAVAKSSYVDPRVLQAVDQPEALAKARRSLGRPRKHLEPAEQGTLALLAEMDRRARVRRTGRR